MSETPKEITLVDVLFDETLLNAYAQQEYRKDMVKKQSKIEEYRKHIFESIGIYPYDNDYEDFIPKSFLFVDPLSYYEDIYWEWKKTVCKLCRPNPKKERYYKKHSVGFRE